MQNSSKFFTFLFARSSKSKIYIRRVEVSKKLLQNSLLSLAFIIGVTSFGAGIFGVFNFDLSQATTLASTLENQTLNQLSLNPNHINTIDYSRPEVTDVYARNSGGPISTADMA